MYIIEADIETVGPATRPIYRIYKEFSAWDNTWKELVTTFYNPDDAKEYINFKNQTNEPAK